MAVKHEIDECTCRTDSKSGMSRLKTFEFSTTPMTLPISVTNRSKGVSNFPQTR